MESKLRQFQRELNTFLRVVDDDIIKSMEGIPEDKLQSENKLLNSIAREYLYIKAKMRRLGANGYSPCGNFATKADLEKGLEKPQNPLFKNPLYIPQHELTEADKISKEIILEKKQAKGEGDPFFDATEEVLIDMLTEYVLAETDFRGKDDVAKEVYRLGVKMAEGDNPNFDNCTEKGKFMADMFFNNSENIQKSVILGMLLGLRKYDGLEDRNLSLEELKEAFNKYPDKIKRKVNNMSLDKLIKTADTSPNAYLKQAARIKALIKEKEEKGE